MECLKGDLELFTKPPTQEPEYLHKVFQTLIINYLAENYDQPFINCPKSDKGREVEFVGITRRSKTSTTVSYRSLVPSSRPKRPAEETSENGKIGKNAEMRPVSPFIPFISCWLKRSTSARQEAEI